LPRHPRQDEMDALRQIPSVFNGVRHYAKKWPTAAGSDD
jgi:hypothetical protein